jgi:hypothetical protein
MKNFADTSVKCSTEYIIESYAWHGQAGKLQG